MSNTLKVLDNFKREMNFRSLREFHTYLSQRGFSANYQHFAKIIKGTTTLSMDILEQLNLAAPELSDQLTLAYCKDLFPKKDYLFQAQLPSVTNQPPDPTESDSTDLRQNLKTTKASHLSESQISILCKKKENYFVFLLCTMARKPILITEINQLMSDQVTKSVILNLVESGIILKTKAGYQTFNTEIKFPPKSKFNEKFYRTLDQWDLEFSTVMNMNSLVTKTMLRRISPRYLGLITSQIQLLIESLRISDESETKYNSEVVQLNISLFQGKLPG